MFPVLIGIVWLNIIIVALLFGFGFAAGVGAVRRYLGAVQAMKLLAIAIAIFLGGVGLGAIGVALGDHGYGARRPGV